jgi:glucan phosphoethanolaminetransferase (alkaline phosphatase superfamily)
MLPCINKKLFGVECFGCGFQRAFIALVRGEFYEACKLYPAIYLLLALAVFALLNWKFKFKYGQKIIIGLAITSLIVVVLSYYIKIN